MTDHPASALLEMIVNQNLGRNDLPTHYQLLAAELPDDIGVAAVEEADLPADWRRNHQATRSIGNRWLDLNETALLRVPSAIVPHAFNWLLNPIHGAAGRATIAVIVRVDLDVRLSS